MYPPTVLDAPVHMVYPEGVPLRQRLVVGNEHFGLLPGLTMYATIWLREHNRVCDILKAEHPTWDDEQLFQTARLIIIGKYGYLVFVLLCASDVLTEADGLRLCYAHPPGEIINIITEEYVQHLSGYYFKLKFDPELLFGERFQYSNRIALEFSYLYHWHPLMPDSFVIDGDEIPYSQFFFNTSLLMHYGVEKMVDAFSQQPAGQVTKNRLSTNIYIEMSLRNELCFSSDLFPQ